MNTNLEEMPYGVDVILYRSSGRPPVIAGKFFGLYISFDEQEIPADQITGWALIPDWEY